MKLSQLLAVMLLPAISVQNPASAQNTAPQLGKDPIPVVIKAMTLEEKAKLVVGTGMSLGGLPQGMSNNKATYKVDGISGHTFAIPRLNIPSLGFVDGPAGIHRFGMNAKDSQEHRFATAWPVGTMLASSWDTALVKRLGVAFGEEMKDYGIDFILGPGANIHRNPLGGRILNTTLKIRWSQAVWQLRSSTAFNRRE